MAFTATAIMYTHIRGTLYLRVVELIYSAPMEIKKKILQGVTCTRALCNDTEYAGGLFLSDEPRPLQLSPRAQRKKTLRKPSSGV